MDDKYFEKQWNDYFCNCVGSSDKEAIILILRQVAREAVEEVNKEWEKRFPCPHEDINVLTGICVICGQIVN